MAAYKKTGWPLRGRRESSSLHSGSSPESSQRGFDFRKLPSSLSTTCPFQPSRFGALDAHKSRLGFLLFTENEPKHAVRSVIFAQFDNHKNDDKFQICKTAFSGKEKSWKN
jgi:hypothetical protein